VSGQDQLETPVAFVLFRRPDRTRLIFGAIRAARPKRLFMIADGPRNAEEAGACKEARAVVDEVDWPCEVTRDFAPQNLGLKHRLPSGLDRVFDEVDRAIVLEDDCLPHASFFPFCDELLERYADDEQVMHVTGSQLLLDPPPWSASYHFSRYVHIWGFATWRRAWRNFDVELREWHELDRAARETRLRSMFDEETERNHWRYVWDGSHEIDNWDAQWSYALLAREGLAANPNRNLISNIGFGVDATNATEDPHGIAARPLEGIEFPLDHPAAVERDQAADAAVSLFYRRGQPASPRPVPPSTEFEPGAAEVTPGPQLETPVALILFRRADRTRRIFEEIRRARPKRLFLIADGPRAGNADEARGCAEARAVVEEVDWPCEVTRDFATENLGLRRRIPSGIDAVFREVERAILLEDDCVPHPTFFRYCDELLERYADEERVMHVGGSQLLSEPPNGGASYHFSRYVHIWGWASWRRAWQHFDGALEQWHGLRPRRREAHLRRWFSVEEERNFWRYVWDPFYEHSNWSAQWSFACISRDALAITPNRNMISNAGFGEDATNATEDPLGIANRPLEGVTFPLTHPTAVEADTSADAATSRLFRIDLPPQTREPLRSRAWAATLRAGGRALDFVPAPIRPRIRHRDRVSDRESSS
jgi:hypothetical protein